MAIRLEGIDGGFVSDVYSTLILFSIGVSWPSEDELRVILICKNLFSSETIFPDTTSSQLLQDIESELVLVSTI